jgi:RNA polymerase sigma-70 factor (sigma-E family)
MLVTLDPPNQRDPPADGDDTGQQRHRPDRRARPEAAKSWAAVWQDSARWLSHHPDSRSQKDVGTPTDRDEFSAFVHATGTRLYRTALLLTGDHHLAEDLTQTTYAKAFASWRRVTRAENPVGYARTMLLNTYLSHRRLRRSGEQPGRATDLTETLATRPDESASAADPSTRIDLLAALALLSPTDRAVLVARYWEDRSISETARDLGVSEAAVRTRAKRAIDRLRPLVRDLEGIV